MIAPTAGERSMHRAIPSMALSDPHSEIKLPPLPPMDPSPREGGTFKFPSFWNNSERLAEREREKERGADRSSVASSSPRYNPYPRTPIMSTTINGNGMTVSNGPSNGNGPSPMTVVVVEDKRPISPMSQPREGWEDKGRDTARDKEMPCGPVGIAALISAAEEKSRERETGMGFRIPA